MKRTYLIVFLMAALWGTVLALLIDQPGYTDAYYYFNAGQRLVQGKGLTDPYVWTYLNAPDHLPGPSQTYWMPLESLAAASSMIVFGANFGAAQIPAVLCFAGLVTVAFWLGGAIGQTRRYSYLAALLVLFSGFYTPFWTTTDTFALYGLIGASALIAIGKSRATGDWRWYALGGALSALAHLTRADGLLLLAVLAICALWPQPQQSLRQGVKGLFVGIAAYLLVMLPWFVRNWSEMGTPLPTGGTQTIWLRGYDELVNYPPGTSAQAFWNWGLSHILQSRWEAFVANLGTFVAVETWVVLGPFALFGLWRCRRNPFCFGALFYALGLHIAMTFIFAYPGYRGGLFHSSAALLPFWAVSGLIGLDQSIGWMAKRRRWHKAQAQVVFSSALIVLAVLLSVGYPAQASVVLEQERRFLPGNIQRATRQCRCDDQ